MASGKQTQQFWECCWAFPHSPRGSWQEGKTASLFASLEVNPHPPPLLNLYFCSARGGSCWLEAPTWSVSLKPGMPGSAESLQEKLHCSLLPLPRRSSRGGNMPVPSWHQSQQFLQPRCALFPSHPNFNVSLFFSFCRRAFPQFPPGGNIPWRPSSRSSRGAEVAGAQLRCGRGNRLDTGQSRAPGEGRSSPFPNPLDAATFSSSSTRRASLPRGTGGLPGGGGGSGGARAWWGAQGPPHSQYGLCAFSLQQETLSPSRSCRTLPVPFPVPRCRTSHGYYSLTTSPSWQPTAAPHSRGGCAGGTGTDMPGHVPAALCDLAAWRRWVPHSTLLVLPAARQIPRGFRRDRCSALAGKSPRDMAAPQRASVSPGCWGCHCCQRSPAEARRRDTVRHR